MFEGQASSSTQQPIQKMQTIDSTFNNSTTVSVQCSGSNHTINMHGLNISSKIPVLSFELPALPAYKIIGRDGDVSKIMSIFKEGNKRVAICGMGGMGKTTLAIYCAHKWMGKCTDSFPPPDKNVKSDEANQFFKNIVYFSVENQSSLEAAVKRLATKLKLEHRIIESQSVEELLKDILNLHQNENLLVILDNLVQVKDVLPLINLCKQCETLYVLATSQNFVLNVHFAIHNLCKISEAESLDLFLNVTGLKIEGDEQTKSDFYSTFHELYELVDGLPISVSHASTWIQQEMNIETWRLSKTTEGYTSLLREYIASLQDKLREDFPEQFDTPITKSAYLTLQRNIEKLANDQSKLLIYILSYLDPSEIEVNILKGFFNETELRAALNENIKFSLIYIEGIFRTNIRIHRLVQEVARIYLEREYGKNLLLILLVLCCYRKGDTHLNFMIENLNDKSKIIEWLNFISKEDLKAAVDRMFELEEYNWTLDRLRDAGCDVRDGANWPLPHKLMAITRWDSYMDAELFYLILTSIFNKFNAECLSSTEDGLSLHHVAAANYKLEIDNIHKYLAEKGIDINKRTIRRQLSPLHIVNEIDYISLLVSAGADVNVRDMDSNTPLHTAAARCDDDIVQAFLKQPGVQLDAENAKNETPLMVAVENKGFDTVKILLEANARYDVRWMNGDTILHRAAKHHYNSLIMLILDRIEQNGQISVDDINLDGDTPAHLTLFRKYYDDDDDDDDGDGDDDGDLIDIDEIISTLQQLVTAGANLNIGNNRGQTPLDLAQAMGLDEKVIDFLKIYEIITSARYNFKFENGDTVLHRAVRYDNNILINFILDRIKQDGQINMDEVNRDGQTALQLAVLWYNFKNARSLLKAGARYDFRLENGDTTLHWAIKYKKELIGSILDRIRKDGQIGVDDVNLDGNTPAHLAVSWYYRYCYGIICTLKLLVAAGADLNIRNNQGQTPLDLAQAEELDEKVIKFLKKPNDYNSGSDSESDSD